MTPRWPVVSAAVAHRQVDLAQAGWQSKCAGTNAPRLFPRRNP